MVRLEEEEMDIVQDKKLDKSFIDYLSHRDSSSMEDCQSDYSLESFHGKSTNESNTNNSTPILSDKTIELLQPNPNDSNSNKSNKKYSSNSKTNQALFDKLGVSLAFDNLNDCVTALLKKSKDEVGYNRDVKKRQRKNKEQLK